ncbi:hypothetical protein AYL99_09053 [Fonsecaea erecta]|uniref:Transcription factor domain-containing protein n=1 Tax=Fonsecaea erecta TaxID=1367422 RepID=A0A178ZBT1_9EURO|nr:hypothetical protein AYL99_09053 [Fonsecaea erecta]OAP56941.1 hypothetical protein AYL99_09053 [Fonsecaea erecta]
MDKEEKSRYLFLVSTPHQRDRSSLKKDQAAARAHAAKISHPSARAQPVPEQQLPGHQVADLKSLAEDSVASSDGEHDQQHLTGASVSVPRDKPGTSSTSKAQTFFTKSKSRPRKAPPQSRPPRFSGQTAGRSREIKQNPGAARPCPPALGVDPLYWLPYEKDEDAYQAVDYFSNIAAPALYPLYEIFNITSVYTSLFLECITECESFYHAGIARLRVTAELLRNPGSKPASSVLLHQAKAISHLRHEIDQATQPTNMMLATILFLIAIDIAIGQHNSADMHRVNLARLVGARGGLDALGRDGFEKAAFMQFDNIYALERGSSVLVTLQRYRPKYPPDPPSPRLTQIINSFPDGFRCLAFHRLLPLDMIELLFRIATTVGRCAGRTTYVPFDTAENSFRYTRRKYDSFSDACPWLFAPEDKVHPLLKPLTMALVLWCSNAYSEIRASTVVYAGFLRALTMRLLRAPIVPKPPISPQVDVGKVPDEEDCLLWIWMVTLDSWRPDGAKSLHPFGEHPSARADPQAQLREAIAETGGIQGFGQTLNVNLPFSAFTSDIITEYCLGKSHNSLDKPGFNEKFIVMMASVHDMSAAAKQFNFMVLVDMLPDSFVDRQDAGMAAFIQFRRASFYN